MLSYDIERAATQRRAVGPRTSAHRPVPCRRRGIRRRIAREQQDDPGHVVMARLTPHEYRNVIRDLETCEIALRAGLTGHLVLTTIHSGSAVDVVTRQALPAAS